MLRGYESVFGGNGGGVSPKEFQVFNRMSVGMGLFGGDEDVQIENAELACTPQNDFVSEEEVAPLDDHLDPGEQVHFLFTGGSGMEIDGEQGDRKGKSRTAVTDDRVLVKVGTIGTFTPHSGHSYQSIRYRDMSSVNLKEGLVTVKLVIESSSKRYGVYLQQASFSDVGQEVVEFIRAQMQASTETGSPVGADDPLAKLEQLRDLKDDGVLTEAEFTEKKQELLDRI
ncbi:SHOCT domain-containing protein [Natronococcus sp. A-GB1]|uniref:SHOCT domain-containing protein n=1 Tax=Natronococcus sp. A-GB1 TaxID=3037648 RepID=UPI00241CE4E7|nr:SHOCT domain-containing protein [Natronococcus sp. A-GB1]MDG5761320.1 SHOCT domain-containing protein [Natronococcus sp. A-GB1]